jgi:predicted dehydrogenase
MIEQNHLNVGVIGYGYWGPNLVRNFAEMQKCSVLAVSDFDPNRLDLAKRRFPQIYTTTNYEELLNDREIDAIVIATPVNTHFNLALAALQAGKHVWLEKPMTETSEQGRILIAEAARRNLILHVDHTFCYTGAVRKMGDIIASGDLGQVLYYDSIRVNLGLFQRDVSVISDLAVHDFAILDFLLKEHPVAVSASGVNHYPGTPENLAYITLFYDSGTIAHAGVNWLAPVKVRQVILGGSKKMIVYDDLSPAEKVKVYDKGVNFTDDPKKIHEMRVGYRTGDMYAPTLNGSEALGVAAEHFLESIFKNKPSITDGRMGMRVVEIIEAATLSMRQRGKTVQIQQLEMAP